MGLGLLLFQGCALLQSPSEIAAPTEPPAQPAAPKTSVGVQPAPSQPVPVQPTAKKSPAVPVKLPQTGEASYYGAQHQGKQTASGTTYDQAALTAAHPSLPFGSKIKVTNLANGKSVEVEITDRGPSAGNRIIDLSLAAAKALEMIESGTATVRLELPSGQ
jgi:rare lipoprotein A